MCAVHFVTSELQRWTPDTTPRDGKIHMVAFLVDRAAFDAVKAASTPMTLSVRAWVNNDVVIGWATSAKRYYRLRKWEQLFRGATLYRLKRSQMKRLDALCAGRHQHLVELSFPRRPELANEKELTKDAFKAYRALMQS